MKRFLLIVSFAFVLFFGYTVNAETMTGRASVGRGHVMDTSYNYYSTDWKLLSDSSLNILPVPSGAGDNFYDMGTEYAFPITLTGQTDFVATVRVPVAGNTIYTYQLMDGLNQYDFKAGIDQNFAVYNVTPDIQLFNHTCGLYSRMGVAHFYCYYDITFAFTLSSPLTGAYNLNFAVLNTNGSRSSYYLSGGNAGVGIEFPTTYFNGDSWDYSVMSPTVRLTTGTTANNQDIIDQSIANTEEIKATIQESYENLVKSQEVCFSKIIDSSSIGIDNYYLNSSGSTVYSVDWVITDYIHFDKINKINTSGFTPSICFYKIDKTLISCSTNNSIPAGLVSVPTDSYYFRASINKNENRPQYNVEMCQNGNQALYDSLIDSSIDDHSVGNFFDNIHLYDESTLSAVITAPLDFINSLDDACTPIVLTYRGQSITLPCGNDIFWDRQDVSTFRATWNALFGGLILYRLLRKLLEVVNNAMNPEVDELGGLDL